MCAQCIGLGLKMLADVDLLAGVREIVEQHHEHWDGSGYPAQLEGDHICLGARVLAVADALDAMLSECSYRQPLSLEQALSELQANAGTQFCPESVAAVMAVPTWELVEVRASDDEKAIA